MAGIARIIRWSLGLTAVLLVTVVVSATVGPVEVQPLTVLKSALNAVAVPTGIRVPAGGDGVVGAEVIPTIEFRWRRPFQFDVPATHERIVVGIRLPRVALAAAVGFALATAGTVMQGFFRNPLADPAIIGVSAGAAAAAVAAITVPALLPLGLRPAAFVGGLVAAGAVYLIATEDGRTPVATLLLAGIAVQAFLGAVISYLVLHSGDSMHEAVYWLMGHLHRYSWGDVAFIAPLSALFFAVLYVYARDLNVLLLGEEEAHNLGVAVERTKRVLLAVSSLVTAAAVAVAGVIGFVGLVVPHMLRLVVGPDHRILLPTAAIGGATFLVAADTIARAGPAEVPVGIVTAAVGAPFFLYLLTAREVHRL
ncbi:MAG: vitamin B12 ABC transporter permease BtuC [Halobacteriales archaeon]